MDDGGAAYIERIAALSEEEERELLDEILTKGFDQGCFLQPEPSDLLSLDIAGMEQVFAALDERDLSPSPIVEDPFEQERPPRSLIDDTESGYVVVSQQCDLLSPLIREPFVELAKVTLESEGSIVSGAKRNSRRLLYVSEGAGGGGWIADLRLKQLMAKDRLVAYPMRQMIGDELSLKRFKLRAGQRYSRDALPGDIVESLQRPLVTHLGKAARATKLSVFTDLLVSREGEQLRVIAVADAGVPRQSAEDAWQEFEDELPEAVLAVISDSSGALPIEDVNFYSYAQGWKLDLDQVTYSGKGTADQSEPTL